MLVGVPKEIKSGEARVGLTPAAVGEYVAHGHRSWSRPARAPGIGADDAAYRRRRRRRSPRARRKSSPRADMIVKVKEPQPEEWAQLRPGQILFTYLHLAADPAQARGLMASGVTAIAYETVTDAQGGLPLLAPMSEVAGRLSIQAAATALQKPNGGRGVLLGGVPGVPAGQGRHPRRRRRRHPGRAHGRRPRRRGHHPRQVAAAPPRPRRSLRRPRPHPLLDPRRGRRGGRSPPTPSSARCSSPAPPRRSSSPAPMLAAHEAAARCSSTSPSTRAAASRPRTPPPMPTRPIVVDGIVHYCVANMPGAVPLTSSHALNNATLPFGLALADHGLAALARDPHLRNGLNVHRGRITHRAVAESLGLDFADPGRADGGVDRVRAVRRIRPASTAGSFRLVELLRGAMTPDRSTRGRRMTPSRRHRP